MKTKIDAEKQKIIAHRNKVWKEYDSWRKTPIFCPALNCEVRATLKGWRHISGMGKKRTYQDIHRRLLLFKYAAQIVGKSTTIQNVTYKNKAIHYALEAMMLIKGENGRSFKKVRVIIEEQRNGSKTFLSVMDKKRK